MHKPNVPTTPLADVGLECVEPGFAACGLPMPDMNDDHHHDDHHDDECPQCINDAVTAGVCPILQSGDYEKLATDFENPETCEGDCRA